MKKIQLTQGKVALVDDADYEWLNQWKWHIISTHGGRHIAAKRTQWPDMKSIYMHRQILGVTDSSIIVDHMDCDPLNNQRGNLRLCDKYQNARNSRPNLGKTTKGVVWNKARSKWVARIIVKGECVYLGGFDDINNAIAAYNEASEKYHGEFSRPNVVKD